MTVHRIDPTFEKLFDQRNVCSNGRLIELKEIGDLLFVFDEVPERLIESDHFISGEILSQRHSEKIVEQRTRAVPPVDFRIVDDGVSGDQMDGRVIQIDGEDRAKIRDDPRSNVQIALVKARETVRTGEEKHAVANAAVGRANDDQTRRLLSFVEGLR